MMNKKDDALRLAFRAFQILRFGGYFEPEEAKLFGDMCALALPMKYRFTREEIEAMQRNIKQALKEKINNATQTASVDTKACISFFAKTRP